MLIGNLAVANLLPSVASRQHKDTPSPFFWWSLLSKFYHIKVDYLIMIRPARWPILHFKDQDDSDFGRPPYHHPDHRHHHCCHHCHHPPRRSHRNHHNAILIINITRRGVTVLRLLPNIPRCVPHLKMVIVILMIIIMVLITMMLMMMLMMMMLMKTKSEAGRIALVCRVLKRQLSLSLEPPLR